LKPLTPYKSTVSTLPVVIAPLPPYRPIAQQSLPADTATPPIFFSAIPPIEQWREAFFFFQDLHLIGSSFKLFGRIWIVFSLVKKKERLRTDAVITITFIDYGVSRVKVRV